MAAKASAVAPTNTEVVMLVSIDAMIGLPLAPGVPVDLAHADAGADPSHDRSLRGCGTCQRF
jgi:hypothetical protein